MINGLRYVIRLIVRQNPHNLASPDEAELEVLQYKDSDGNWKDVLVDDSFIEVEKYTSDGKLLKKETLVRKKSIDKDSE